MRYSVQRGRSHSWCIIGIFPRHIPAGSWAEHFVGTNPYLGTFPGQIGWAYTRVDNMRMALLKALTPVLLETSDPSQIFKTAHDTTIRNWGKSSTWTTAVGFLLSSKKLSWEVKHSRKQAFPPIQEPRNLSTRSSHIHWGPFGACCQVNSWWSRGCIGRPKSIRSIVICNNCSQGAVTAYSAQVVLVCTVVVLLTSGECVVV